MKGRKHRPLLVLDRFTPNLGNSLNVGKQSTGRYVSEGDDQFWRYQFQLILQDLQTGSNLHRFRVAVSRRAAFDNIGDIDILPVNADAVNHLRQQFSGTADKGFSLGILIRSGAFSNEHQRGLGYPVTEDQFVPAGS